MVVNVEAPIDPRTLAELLVKLAVDMKATDPAILEVGPTVGYTDYMVIVSARNPRLVRAIAEEIRVRVKQEHDLLPVGVEGLEAGTWVLVDYDDVVLHVFHDETRRFYDVEGLWSDAKRLPVPATARPTGPDADLFFP